MFAFLAFAALARLARYLLVCIVVRALRDRSFGTGPARVIAATKLSG
jgi:hypothetical protein